MEKASDTADFQQKVMAHGDKPVLIQFSADWCGPCKLIESDLASLAEDYKGEVGFVYADVEQLEEVAEAYSVTDLPLFVMTKNLETKGTFQGNKMEKIKELVENAVGKGA